MRNRVFIGAWLFVLLYAHAAESGGAVQKAKMKNTRPRIHVQVPTPRIHLTQQPVMEGSPTIHVVSPNQEAPPPEKEPEPVYESRVLSTEKPDLTPRSAPAADTAEEIVDLPHLVNSLRTSSQAWTLIVDNEDKQVVVQEFINRFHEQGVTIQKPAAYYQNFIDELSQRNPAMLDMPFERILQVATVMEYDFDNGQDKDEMAQKILGPQVYERNKQRVANQASTPQAQPQVDQ